MRATKVYLLQEIIPSYRVPVFRRLAQLDGVELTVFHSRPSKAMKVENLQNAKNLQGFHHVKLRLLEIGRFSYQFGILWHVLINRPDVMIAGNADCLDRLFLLMLCKLLRVRILWFEGGVHYSDEAKIQEYANRGRLNRLFGKYNPKRLLMHRADGLVVYSKHAKRYYMMLRFREETIWIAPNSPDTEALNAYREEWTRRQEELDAERKRFAPEGQKILFLLGRLNKERKVDVLLHSLQRLQSDGLAVSLVIVGDGGEREHLERMAAHLGLSNVFFEGAIYDEKELGKYFMVSDVFVAPGAASLALKMAMTFGKPVVTGDYGLEVHDIKEGVNGFIVPIDDAAVLTGKLRLLLESDELMQQIGENGIATIRDSINIDMMIEGFRRAIFAERNDHNVGQKAGTANSDRKVG